MNTFSGLQVEGDTPQDRRANALALTDKQIGEAISDMCDSHRDEIEVAEAELCDVGCIPSGELLASPFGLRANILGIVEGAAAVHHELRVPITGQSLDPRSNLYDAYHGEWEIGVRHIGKYQSFRHDEPFIVYNPNHMAKWTPHEMLHRALGFFHRDSMSRWEYYLASRLNELLPVVHWYGTDEILRLKFDGFDREASSKSPGAQRADAQWITLGKGETRTRARGSAHLLRETIERFDEEIAAVRREIETGYQQRVLHPFLDSASDALAYVSAHFDRISTLTVRAVLENAVPDDACYTHIEDYLDATEVLFDSLLFGDIKWDAAEARKNRKKRAVWDLLLRGALHSEVDANCFVRGVEGAPTGFWDKLSNVRVLLSESLPAEAKDSVNATGFAESLNRALHTTGPRAPMALRSAEEIAEGLDSVMPVAMSVVSSELIADFASAMEPATSWQRDRLWRRFHEFVVERSGTKNTALGELIMFEASLYQERPENDQIQCLSSWPGEDSDDAHDWLVVRSPSYGRYTFLHDIPEWHARLAEGAQEAKPERRQTDVLIGMLDGSPCVVGICPAFTTVFDTMQDSAVRLGDVLDVLERGDLRIFGLESDSPQRPIDWVVELAEAQCIGLMPPIE